MNQMGLSTSLADNNVAEILVKWRGLSLFPFSHLPSIYGTLIRHSFLRPGLGPKCPIVMNRKGVGGPLHLKVNVDTIAEPT